MKPFTEEARYEYDLTPDSTVIDVGAHMGSFSKAISERYHCNVIAFEPIAEFYQKAHSALERFPKVFIHHSGLGAKSRFENYHKQGDSTGMFAGSHDIEHCPVVSIDAAIHGLLVVDLLKLNCEGGEYEILEHILSTGIAARFKNIQVQFHTVVYDWENRYRTIRDGLLKTHHLTFDAPMVWENYEIQERNPLNPYTGDVSALAIMHNIKYGLKFPENMGDVT